MPRPIPYLSPTQGHCFSNDPFCVLYQQFFPLDCICPISIESSYYFPFWKTKQNHSSYFPLKALHIQRMSNFSLDHDFLEKVCILTICWSCLAFSTVLTTLGHILYYMFYILICLLPVSFQPMTLNISEKLYTWSLVLCLEKSKCLTYICWMT